MWKKMLIKGVILFLGIFYIGWNGYLFSSTIETNDSQITEEDYIKEIKELIKKFGEKDPTEKIQRQAQLRLSMEFGLKALPYLRKALENDNDQIRYFALYTIQFIISRRILNEGKREHLGKVDVTKLLFLSEEEKKEIEQCFQSILPLWKDPNPKIRKMVAFFLGTSGKKEVIPIVENLLNDPDVEVRLAADSSFWVLTGEKLNRIKIITGKEPQTPEEYAEYLKKRDEWGVLYIEAGQEIKKFGKKAIPVLINLAKSDKEPGRCTAIRILGEMKSEEAIPVFIDYLKEDTKDETMYSVQLTCISALFNIDTENSIRMIEEYGLGHKNPEIRYFTVEKIYRIINPISESEKGRYPQIEKEGERLREKAKGVMRELMKDGDNEKRYEIGIFLLQNKEKEGIPILIGLMKEKGYLRKAKDCLEEATGQDFGEIPPIVSKKMLEEYIKKWEDWWEKNKDTFKFPEEKN